MVVHHIFLPGVFATFNDEIYAAESLATEGFIHCSYTEQLDAVIERYYGDAEQLVILDIETRLLTSPLREEPSTNDEIYPHVYGPINRDAIVAVNIRNLKQ